MDIIIAETRKRLAGCYNTLFWTESFRKLKKMKKFRVIKELMKPSVRVLCLFLFTWAVLLQLPLWIIFIFHYISVTTSSSEPLLADCAPLHAVWKRTQRTKRVLHEQGFLIRSLDSIQQLRIVSQNLYTAVCWTFKASKFLRYVSVFFDSTSWVVLSAGI